MRPRPAAPAESPRGIVSIRLAANERDPIAAAAQARGQSLSEFMRDAALRSARAFLRREPADGQ